MYRYRYTGALSRQVLDRFNKHKSQLGDIVKVQAKRYRATKQGSDGPYTTDYEVLTVYGTTGSARFSGTCWGYFGEGTRATHSLLTTIGLSDEDAKRYAFQTERKDKPGIDWEINLTPH
jgi:hypothetical protein